MEHQDFSTRHGSKGLADLAEKVRKKPDFFRGRLTNYNDTSSYGMFGAWQLYKHHGEKLWTWLDIIGPVTRRNPPVEPKSRRFCLGIYDELQCGGDQPGLSSVKKAGKLVGWKYMEDGNVVMLRGMAIPQKSLASTQRSSCLISFFPRKDRW